MGTKIKVRQTNDTYFFIYVNLETDTIEQMKFAIRDAKHIEPDSIRIMWRTVTWKDDAKLSTMGLKDGHQVHIIPKYNGGSGCQTVLSEYSKERTKLEKGETNCMLICGLAMFLVLVASVEVRLVQMWNAHNVFDGRRAVIKPSASYPDVLVLLDAAMPMKELSLVSARCRRRSRKSPSHSEAIQDVGLSPDVTLIALYRLDYLKTIFFVNCALLCTLYF